MDEHVQLDFLIIGATKAATTWLQCCLQQQPSVFMPDPELHYFSREYDRGAAWYNGFFADVEKGTLKGEKSNSYFDQPEAMSRIRKHMPGTKLILQLRNPIERAYSDYCMLYRRGEVASKIERYFRSGDSFSDRFLESGRYAHHLDHIDRFFPKEQLLILIYDDVLNQPIEHLDRVRNFLSLKTLTPIKTKVKDKTDAIVPIPIRKALKGLKPVVAPYRGQAWFEKTRALIAREPRYPALTPDLHAHLRDYYSQDIEALARRLNRDLTPWLKERPESGG